MYTIIDPALDEQLKHPIRPRKSVRTARPGESRARGRKDDDEGYAPWKVPFPTEEEWQAYLKDFLESLQPHREARDIVVGVLKRLRERQEQSS